MSLTSPLGLIRHVRRPNLRFEVVPWLNVMLVGWLMTLLGSSYIFAPGIATGLIGPPNIPNHLDIPTSQTPPTLMHIDAVLTILPPYYYLEDGRHYKQDLPNALSLLVKRIRTHSQHPVLLVKVNSTDSVQIYNDVCEMAKQAGFETIEQATIPIPSQNTDTPPSTK